MNSIRRAPAIIGTDKQGRPFTDAEKAHFSGVLRVHDFVGASMVALRFAYKLTRSQQAARDLVGRANLLLVRQGWDPNEVPLVKRLCRLVWCEWSHLNEESEAARRAEESFLTEQQTIEGRNAVSAEEQAVRLEDERQAQERALAKLGKLRDRFLEAKDEVNLIWLELTLQGETDLGAMAERSGRDVKEFYRAADRRKRHVERLLQLEGGQTTKEKK